MSSNSHTVHLKCASYINVTEADDASDDLQEFNRNDKNGITLLCDQNHYLYLLMLQTDEPHLSDVADTDTAYKP